MQLVKRRPVALDLVMSVAAVQLELGEQREVVRVIVEAQVDTAVTVAAGRSQRHLRAAAQSLGNGAELRALSRVLARCGFYQKAGQLSRDDGSAATVASSWVSCASSRGLHSTRRMDVAGFGSRTARLLEARDSTRAMRSGCVHSAAQLHQSSQWRRQARSASRRSARRSQARTVHMSPEQVVNGLRANAPSGRSNGHHVPAGRSRRMTKGLRLQRVAHAVLGRPRCRAACHLSR